MTDVDGLAKLTFDEFDATLWETLTLDFNWFSTPHQEAGDFFAVEVNGDQLFNRVNGTSNMTQTGVWGHVQLDLSSYDQNSSLNVVFQFQSNANDEHVYFGSIQLSNTEITSPPPSTPVPEPGMMILMGTGLFGLIGYNWIRRKKHTREV